MPHVTVRTLDGRSVAYAGIWQRSFLVLVLVQDADPAAAAYAARLRAALSDVRSSEVEAVVTCDPVPGAAPPAAIVADRWGGLVFVARAAEIADLPDPQELASWLRFAQMQCPECEGEAR